jgi:hypothetical protein
MIKLFVDEAKVISKYDLKGGFHQIVKDEASRHVTTFRSPFGFKDTRD